jgi:hypothetical protein
MAGAEAGSAHAIMITPSAANGTATAPRRPLVVSDLRGTVRIKRRLIDGGEWFH